MEYMRDGRPYTTAQLLTQVVQTGLQPTVVSDTMSVLMHIDKARAADHDAEPTESITEAEVEAHIQTVLDNPDRRLLLESLSEITLRAVEELDRRRALPEQYRLMVDTLVEGGVIQRH
jgi:hypothetical protein